MLILARYGRGAAFRFFTLRAFFAGLCGFGGVRKNVSTTWRKPSALVGSGDLDMMTKSPIVKANKAQAAGAQLSTAIRLWFSGEDPISAHALAFSAYEVFHVISKKRDKYRRDLLFDSDWIKDDFRRPWNDLLKKEAVFFKHADRDPDDEVELDPDKTMFFILFAGVGRALAKEPQSEEESAFLWWLQIHRPDLLTDEGRQMVTDRIPVDALDHLRGVSKSLFFKAWSEARRQARNGGPRIGAPHFHIVG